MPRVRQPGEPVEELTRFGWILIPRPGKEAELNKLLCTKTSIDDHGIFCRLDILGITDIVCE